VKVIERSKLLLGGRLVSVRKDVVNFTSSIKSDQELLKSTIKINEAHVVMMMEQKIIEWSSGAKLLQALNGLSSRAKLISAEDVHMAIEEEVFKKVGSEIGGNLHIAKSRNDQVATAIRMKLHENIVDVTTLIVRLQETLAKLARKHTETVVPGYTHLQPAQPVVFAYYLLSYVDGLERDVYRLRDVYQRIDLCPMGAGALATSTFPINRKRVAQLLGFSQVLENSIDAVGSRDFALETMAALTITAVDISRLVEDLIIWSSLDFGLIELPDSFSSTSSIMPQKKNPDVLEVIRARMSHVLGNFVTSVTTMKSLPSSYNLDLQEVTPRLWESLETIASTLSILSKLVPNLNVSKNIREKPYFTFLTSTELANMLVRKHKVPFRSAHKIVGSLIRFLTAQKLTLNDVTPELLRKVAKDSLSISLDIGIEDIHEATDSSKIIRSYAAEGSPSPTEVKRMLKTRRQKIIQTKSYLAKKKLKFKKTEDRLQSLVQSYSSSHDMNTAKLKNPPR
jgi:argininosuccinate lyase